MEIQEVAREVFLVRGVASNWVMLREDGALTLVDAGYPGDLTSVLAGIARIGSRPEDLRAVLVTHAHVDHVGAVPALLERREVPVLAHPEELPLLHGERTERIPTSAVLRRCWRPRVARWTLKVARAGGAGTPLLPTAEAFTPGETLDVPGRPVPVPSGGHTPGHTAYLLPAQNAVITGDALVTGHDVVAGTGPQLIPQDFTHDAAGADTALDALRELPADLLLPGHGAAWRGPIRDAVDMARRRGPAPFGGRLSRPDRGAPRR